MLREIATANRLFGGRRTAWHGLLRFLDGDTTSRSLLDIGTGAGDLPRDLARRAARRGIALRTLGLERIPAAAELAHAHGLPTMLACGGTLPLADRSVDVVLLSQLVHHLDDPSAVALLREATRVARQGVIVADLRPSRASALAFRAAGTLLGFHRVTIEDGIVSLRRGRNAEALVPLALAAGGRAVQGTDLPLARVLVTWGIS
jgi:SAM-dependent methyltransferase